METVQTPPLKGYSFFIVETFARMYYIMVRDEEERSRWLKAFDEVLLLQRTDPSEIRSLADVESVDSFLARPVEWDLQQRRVLNLRKIVFNTADFQDYLQRYVLQRYQMPNHAVTLVPDRPTSWSKSCWKLHLSWPAQCAQ